MTNYSIDNMSLDEKLGQLIVFGFDALEINDHALHLIKQYKAGNIILFARNVKTPEQVYQLNQNLQKLAMKEIGIPLLISIDQEGGMVTRIKNGGTFFPGAMTLGATNQVVNSYKSGKYMGQELISLGINMNLAPVLDINNNPHNPVIGVRSYSDQKEKVKEYGLEFIKGMQENVIATAKHFPGHGDTTVDSHLALAAIHKSMDEITELELAPFKHAIDNGLHAIMSAHINFPAITEEGRPTTLSKNCLTGLLRETLNFKGLIITDCMQMKAIQKDYTTPKGVVMAIEAGANLVCVSHSEEFQTKSLIALKDAVLSNQLSMDTINNRVEKILEYKNKYIVPKLEETYQDVQPIVENKDTKDFAYGVVKDAFTLVKGNNITRNIKTLLIASEPISTTIADEDDGSYSIIQSVNNDLPNLDTLKVSVSLTDEEIKHILETVSDYKQIIFCSYNANIYQKQISLINQLEHENLTVIMMRNPYDSFFTPNIKNLLAMYEYTPNSVKVLVEYLKGNVNPQGTLPVRL